MKTKTIQDQFAAAQRAADKHADKAKTVDLPDVLRQVYHDLDGEIPLEAIQRVVLAEQAATATLLARGFRVSKHNYMTLHTSGQTARKMTCPLDGKQYELPAAVRVNVRVGTGLKRAVQKAAGPKPKATAGAAPGDKKRPDSQRNAPGQAGAKPRAKRVNPDTLAATAEGAAT